MAYTYKNWTTEEDNLLRKVSLEGKEYKELCSLYFPDRTALSLQSRASALKIKSKHRYRKNFFKKDFWETPNLINSFWAGVMAADGNIGIVNKKPQSLNWEISVIDECFMDEFIKEIGYTGKKRYWSKKTQKGNISKTVKVRIHSQKWVESLAKNFSIVSHKANRIGVPENLTFDQQMAFLIGYTNGDGCICLSGGNLMLTYTSASKGIIEWIANFANSLFTQEKKKPRKIRTFFHTGEYYSISISGRSAEQIFVFLSQFEVPVLDRKWKREEVLVFVKQKYEKAPSAFSDYLWNEKSLIYNILKTPK